MENDKKIPEAPSETNPEIDALYLRKLQAEHA